MTRAVVVGEADEAGVLHADRLGAHRRPQDTLGKRDVVGEFDGVGPFGDGPDLRNRLVGVAAGAQVGLQLVELLVEVGSGEPVAERVEDVVGGLAGSSSRASSTAERWLRRGGPVPTAPDGGERSRVIDRGAARCVDDAGAEPDRGAVPFPDGPDAHHESQAACGRARLVGVGDDAGVAQRRAFDGVLAGERRAEQQHSRVGELQRRDRAGRRVAGVPAEGANRSR